MKFVLTLTVLILITLLAVSAQAQTKQYTIRFSVIGENQKFIENLKPSDLQIEVDKNTFQIDDVNQKFSQSLDVAVMVDVSTSQERILPVTKVFLSRFIDEMLKSGIDRVAVVKFSDKVSIQESLTNDFIKAKSKINELDIDAPPGYVSGGILVVPPSQTKVKQGGTSLWDSVKKTTEDIFDKSPARKIIILVTDGVDTASENNRKEVAKFMREKQIPVYAVGIGDEYYDGVSKKALTRLTKETGGIVFIAGRNDGFRPIFKTIEQSARSYYEASFVVSESSKEVDSSRYKIVVTNPTFQKSRLVISQSQPY